MRFARLPSLLLAATLSTGCAADPAATTGPDRVIADAPALAQLNEWDDYVMTDLGDFGGTYNTAIDINDAGQIIGVSAPTPGNAEIRRAWVSDGVTLTMLPVPDPRYSSRVAAINSSGDVLGSNLRLLLWTRGTTRDLSATYPALRSVRDLNDAGTIVGDCAVPHAQYQFACIASAGTTIVMDTAGYRSSTAEAINNAGLAVGSLSGWRSYLPLAWSGGTPAALAPLPGSTYASAAAVNDAGIVVGRSSRFSNWRATMWVGGTPIDLGAVHGNASWANAINRRGEVVGVTLPIFNGTEGNARPFLWRNGVMRVLPMSGARVEGGEAAAINAKGEIVGTLLYPNNERRAVVWRRR